MQYMDIQPVQTNTLQFLPIKLLYLQNNKPLKDRRYATVRLQLTISLVISYCGQYYCYYKENNI